MAPFLKKDRSLYLWKLSLLVVSKLLLAALKLLGLVVRSFLACCYKACFLVLGFNCFLACKFINNSFLVICQAVVLFAFLWVNVYIVFAQCVFCFRCFKKERPV